MQEYSFATLVSFSGSIPIATHLPFSIAQEGEGIRLITHMAKANPQWKSFSSEQDVLVIFQGPHAYISPTHYDSKATVPTWNYIAVHAFGKPSILDITKHDSVLRTIVNTFEPGYTHQYNELPDDYLESHLKAIVCIEIAVSRLEGKFKLSQDKKEVEKKRIIETMSASTDSAKHGIASAMKENTK